MKKNLKNLILIILAVLAISAICYPQTKFWEPVSSNPLSNPNIPLEHRNAKGCAITNNGDIFVLTEEGVFLSADNGDTWVQKHVFPGTGISHVEASANGSIFVIYNSGTYMFRSTDKGESWKVIKKPNYADPGAMLVTESGEIYLRYSDPFGITGICYSKDNGDTWIVKPAPYDFATFAMGADGTLYASVVSSDYISFVHGVYRSTDAGDSWLPPSNNIIDYVIQIIFLDDSTMFGIGSSSVIKSTDKGVTWRSIELKAYYNYNSSYQRKGVVYNPITGHLVAFGLCGGICRSTDLGETWSVITSSLPAGNITSCAIDPTTGMLFVTLNDIKNESSMVYHSTQNIDRIDIDIADPELIDFNPNYNIISFDQIYIGSDLDTAICIKNRGKIDVVIRSIHFDKSFYDNSQFRTNFNGPVVIKPNEEYKYSITFNPKREGTPNAIGSFSYRTELEILTDVIYSKYILLGLAIYQPISVEEPAEIPTDYSLLQNYPNPFNPTTKIEYLLPVASKVRLSVYNSLGQEVATLIDEHQGMGKHIVDFSANNLPSGIYFYKLQTDKFNAVKKMMLVK